LLILNKNKKNESKRLRFLIFNRHISNQRRKKMKVTKDFYDRLPDFDTYYNEIKELFEAGKTTGPDQSEAMLNYTKLSLARTKRGLKTFSLKPELIELAKKHTSKNWFLISEAWCGDAGNIIPMMKLLADEVGGVTLKVMLRDEHPEVMDSYLTNGGKSIPIFILFDEEFNQLKKWGPRPEPAQNMVLEFKKNAVLSYEYFSIELQKWYVQDKGVTLQNELIELFK
jgi:hypothetical protein